LAGFKEGGKFLIINQVIMIHQITGGHQTEGLVMLWVMHVGMPNQINLLGGNQEKLGILQQAHKADVSVNHEPFPGQSWCEIKHITEEIHLLFMKEFPSGWGLIDQR
jgi:hypothetical protein